MRMSLPFEWRQFASSSLAAAPAMSLGTYENDCRSASTGENDEFQAKLYATEKIIEDIPFILGAFVNEVGMLRCAMDTLSTACVPNGPTRQYPADQ